MGSLVSLSYGFLLIRDMSLITYMMIQDRSGYLPLE